jgi:uncharacterized protein with von Willebrand factor type A (vWA) domain
VASWQVSPHAMSEGPFEPDRTMLAFSRALRDTGVAVTRDRSIAWLQAAALLGIGDYRAVRCAGRATLCASLDDVTRFDRLFDAFFHDQQVLLPNDAARESKTIRHRAVKPPSQGEEEVSQSHTVAYASAVEVLRRRDVALMDEEEKTILNSMIGGLDCRAPVRRVRRRSASHAGQIDGHRTLQLMARRHGEIVNILRRRPAARPRRIVVLLDISHSMSAYSEALLRVAHRYVTTVTSTEVFTLGTRLTRVTPALRIVDPEHALAQAGLAVPDWSGGTRLGDTLRAFLNRWGQRGLARGAAVIVLSDGWERGDTTLLREQAARLSRVSYRVIWVNPHRGKPGYEPQQAGIVAVLPFVDEFLAGHSQEAFERLCVTVANL